MKGQQSIYLIWLLRIKQVTQIILSKQYPIYSRCSPNVSWTTTYIIKSIVEKSPQPRKSYPPLLKLSIEHQGQCKVLLFPKLLIQLALQKAFNIICIYTEKWSLRDFTLAASHTTKNDFKKQQQKKIGFRLSTPV